MIESYLRGFVSACDRLAGPFVFVCITAIVALSVVGVSNEAEKRDVPTAAIRAPLSLPETAQTVGPMLSNPPPPEYTDPNLTITNGLGGMGFAVGWKLAVPTTTAVDALSGTAPSSVPTRNFLRAGYAGSTLWQPGNYTVNPRVVIIKRTADDASDANLAICARPGTTDGGFSSSPLPPLACGDNNATGDAGGCYLASTGDFCVITLRPMRGDCGNGTTGPTWDTCHTPIWIVASGGTTLTSFVSVNLWQ